MKWGRKKSSPSSSSSVSRPSLFFSWLSKLKKMAINDPVPEPEHGHVKLNVNGKEKGRPSWSSMSSLANGSGGKGGGRIYGGEDETFWRLPSGDEGFDGKKSRGVLGSALYNDSSDDETGEARSSFRSSRSNRVRKEESQTFKDMVFSIKVKELPEDKREIEIKTPRKGSVKEMKFRNTHRRVLEERLLKLDKELEEEERAQPGKPAQKQVLEVKPERRVQPIYNYNMKTIDEDHIPAAPNFQQNGKVMEQKLKELKLTTEKHRKSYYISRELQGRTTKQLSKVRVYSPRTPTKVEICKIKALEDLKRARLKTKKKAKETTVLESLAVVKCSFDPEKDFRDSMMEMILEEHISKPEELEELLACYLTLNADEYHDLIIKVFRQVWLDINEICLHTETHGEDC